MRHAVALLVLAAVAAAAPVPKALKAKRPDAEVFVGTWETVVKEVDGRPVPKTVWTFDADLTMWSKSPGEGGQGTRWAVKIAPDATPKRIDIDTFLGVYEFDGDDIRLAYTLNGDRPTTFDAKPGVYNVVIRRVKEGGK
jgi:uncharacterized protein (TIGR03067 family)